MEPKPAWVCGEGLGLREGCRWDYGFEDEKGRRGFVEDCVVSRLSTEIDGDGSLSGGLPVELRFCGSDPMS